MMPTYQNDITDVAMGNNIDCRELSFADSETNDTLQPRINYGYKGGIGTHPPATVTGDIRVIVERSDGQDIVSVYPGQVLSLLQNQGETTWSGAVIGGFEDVTTVTRVNFYWTQTG